MYSLGSILRQIRSLRGGDDAATVSDGELLRRFQTKGDQAAFELLVWRHGPMVLGVCRRVLNDFQAAEDAFQATFLTLARKAGSIGVRDAIAGWLYTVAHRVALAERTRLVRRAEHERSVDATEWSEPGYLPPDEPAERELRAHLRAEVDRLPDAFRTVIVLCCLEGRSQAEAAQQLGVPTGTIESRLSRARERLRRGLAERGMALAAFPFATVLAELAGELSKVSPVLVYSTMQLVLLLKVGALVATSAAAELMEETVKRSSSMFRVVVAAAVVAAASLGVGISLIQPAPAGEISPPLESLSRRETLPARTEGVSPIQPVPPAKAPDGTSTLPRFCHPNP